MNTPTPATRDTIERAKLRAYRLLDASESSTLFVSHDERYTIGFIEGSSWQLLDDGLAAYALLRALTLGEVAEIVGPELGSLAFQKSREQIGRAFAV
jgi:hypothetical protein